MPQPEKTEPAKDQPGAAGNDGGGNGDPPADEKQLPQSEVDRIVAKQRRELEAKIKAADDRVARVERENAELKEAEGKARTVDEAADAKLKRQQKDWETREKALLAQAEETAAALKREKLTNAFQSAMAGRIVDSPDLALAYFMGNSKIAADGAVVFVNPAKDGDEMPPAKAVDIFLEARPNFARSPQGGPGVRPAGAPKTGIPAGKSYGDMTADELFALSEKTGRALPRARR